MSVFELEESAVAATEQMLSQTGARVREEANRAASSITSLHGSAWEGQAMSCAGNKQTGEFLPVVQKLQAEIDHIAEALGLGRRTTISADAEYGTRIQNVELANFARI